MTDRVRLETLLAREGPDAAKAWARRTAELYRRSVSDPMHFASQPDWSSRFQQLIIQLEQFAETGVLPE